MNILGYNMKKLKGKTKNTLYFFYRITAPFFDLLKFVYGLKGYIWFFRDYIKFYMTSEITPKITNIFPQLHDKKNFTPFDAHYFYQQIWVFENVLKRKPKSHIDIASTYELSGYLSKIVPTTFIDYRPVDTKLKNLKIMRGDITDLPLEDNSVSSLSCLHVLEHIGLGRYGDPVDSLSYKKAVSELQRVLKSDGLLYFSTPIGKEAVYFNAHRVFFPLTIIELFFDLKLLDFSVVDDDGNYLENQKPEKFSKLNYGCGLFLFTRK